MGKMRLTRRLDAGILKIEDRKQNEAGEFEKVFHILKAQHSPTYASDDKMAEVEVDDPKNPGKKKKEKKATGEKKPKLDARGKQLIDKPGMAFDVFDDAFVLEKHGSILEQA